MDQFSSRKSLKIAWILSLAYVASSLGLATGVHAETFTLDFNSLPSNQGWSYRGSPLAEGDTFRVDGSSLVQTTVGSGTTTAYYRMENIVNSSEPLSLSFTARVLSHEDSLGSAGGWGFYINIVDSTSILRLGFTDTSVDIQGERLNLDTTVFHDYAFAYLPNGSYEFFIDGQLRKSGNVSGITGGNWISFGDSRAAGNTDVEVTAFSFTVASGAAPDVDIQKIVDNQYPAANEPVEFTVAVNNIGVGIAADLVVVDKLPLEMSIPIGTAAFTSIGSYDPVTGEWMIGDLDVGIEAVLVVPAVVTEQSPPACITNFASATHPRDGNSANDRAYAVIHQNDIDHCVDLHVDFGISVGPRGVFPNCNLEGQYSGHVDVTNSGPDTARNVVVTISQDPIVGPNLRFDDPNCTNAPAARCNVTMIASGETVTIDVTSDLFQSHSTFTQTITVNATTSDPDVDLSNNNPSDIGIAGGFSSCPDGPDIDIPHPLEGGSSGCFIATAAYGSPLHRDLDSLRGFRNRFMMTNRPGRALVGFYYRHSPPVADFIAEREWLRAVVRGLLAPIVYTIEYPELSTLLIIILITTALVRRRHRRLAALA